MERRSGGRVSIGLQPAPKMEIPDERKHLALKKLKWMSGTESLLSVRALAASVTLLQLLTANRYGYFGDELYRMACGERSAWGLWTHRRSSPCLPG